jgi:hypothetical protein
MIWQTTGSSGVPGSTMMPLMTPSVSPRPPSCRNKWMVAPTMIAPVVPSNRNGTSAPVAASSFK